MFGGFKNIFGGGGSAGDIVSYVGIVGGQEFRNEMRKIDMEVRKAGKSSMTMGKLFKRGAKIATVALASITIATSSMAANFEKKMANVHTLLDVSNKEFTQLKKGVLDVSVEVGKSASGLAVATYDLVSAGVAAKDTLNVLKLSAKAATAGVTDTQTAVRAGMSVINAYALDINQLSKVYDIQFKTVKKGVLTFEQYAGAIGTVLPSATALGVELEDLHASIAVLTKSGQSADMATTNLARMFQAFVEQKDKFKELGINIFNATGKFRGVMPIIGDLARELRGLSDEEKQAKLQMLDLDIRAGRAVIPLSQLLKTTGGLKETIGETKNAFGAWNEAFQKTAQTTSHQFDVLKASIGAVAIEMGSELLPMINEIAKDFQSWVKQARESGQLKEIFAKIGSALKTTWEAIKKIGEFVSSHGDVILYAFGALLVTKIVATVATFAANIGTLTAALKGLKAAIAGGWFAKMIAGISAGGTAIVAFFASLGYAVSEFAEEHKKMNTGYVLLNKHLNVWRDLKTGIMITKDEFGNWVEWGKENLIPYIETVGAGVKDLKNDLYGVAAAATAAKNAIDRLPKKPDPPGPMEPDAERAFQVYKNKMKKMGYWQTADKIPIDIGLKERVTKGGFDIENPFADFKDKFNSVISEIKPFQFVFEETFNVIEMGADRAARGIAQSFIKGKFRIKDIWKQMAADFMTYFIKEIMKLAALAVLKLVKTLMMFDVHKNDMMAKASGVDYAHFFTAGVKEGLVKNNLVDRISPQPAFNINRQPLVAAGTDGQQNIKIIVEQRMIPIPEAESRAWLEKSNKEVLMPHTTYVEEVLKTKKSEFDVD